jgi:Spy/CpxP family protein refolding chaperone
MTKKNRLLGWVLALGSVAAIASACSHGHWRSPSDLSDAELEEKIGDRVEHVLGKVDATDKQVGDVKAILTAAIPDARALRADRKLLMQEFQAALQKPQVDPAELEALRQKALSLFDRASARGMRAVVDVSSQLDAKQRSQLITEWNEHMGS